MNLKVIILEFSKRKKIAQFTDKDHNERSEPEFIKLNYSK